MPPPILVYVCGGIMGLSVEEIEKLSADEIVDIITNLEAVGNPDKEASTTDINYGYGYRTITIPVHKANSVSDYQAVNVIYPADLVDQIIRKNSREYSIRGQRPTTLLVGYNLWYGLKNEVSNAPDRFNRDRSSLYVPSGKVDIVMSRKLDVCEFLYEDNMGMAFIK